MDQRILILSLLLVSAAVSAQTVKPRVRTGVLVRTEFTAVKPDADSDSPVSGKSSPAWAVLTLAPDARRAVSIFDYALRRDGTEYKCLDMAEGDGRFRGTQRNYSSPQGGTTCRLVFAVPSAEEEYEIVFKLIPGEENPVKLNVKPPPEPKKAADTPAAEASKK